MREHLQYVAVGVVVGAGLGAAVLALYVRHVQLSVRTFAERVARSKGKVSPHDLGTLVQKVGIR